MFFTECARLAERHPDLAGAVQKVDAQLATTCADGVIRASDLASFLGIDPNQVNAVLEKLTHQRLLLAEELVECGQCCMAVLRAEYQQQLEDEGEYRCTSCDRPLTDESVKTITTYRRGEKWEDVSNPSEGSECTDIPEPFTSGISHMKLDDQAWYTHGHLAEILGVGKDALRKRLDRYREHHLNGWKVNEDRRPREPKYLYRPKDVMQIIEELQASSERPAK